MNDLLIASSIDIIYIVAFNHYYFITEHAKVTKTIDISRPKFQLITRHVIFKNSLRASLKIESKKKLNTNNKS